VAIVAGIDEAGLGPVLGPLVVSSAVFHVPDDAIDQPLWPLLAGSVVAKPLRRGQALAIGDSKKLFKRKKIDGLEHLERATLAALRSRNFQSENLADLLKIIAPQSLEHIRQYPWYKPESLSIPTCISQTDLDLSSNVLDHGLGQANIKLLSFRAMPVFVGEYNHIIAATRNKSTASTGLVYQLVMRIWKHIPPGAAVRICIDRQGGRKHYLTSLERIFEGCQLRITEETDARSAYIVRDGNKTAEIIFSIKADATELPVALASMLSKYLRELLMSQFNAFWTGLVEGLAPTAGYYTDGKRFYEQILPEIKKLGLDENIIWRNR